MGGGELVNACSCCASGLVGAALWLGMTGGGDGW